MTKLFVYGTLKRGYYNWERILKDRSQLVGEATSTDAAFAMYDAESFPILAADPDGDRVIGDVFEVDDEVLARCDSLEGHPHWYCREEREFTLDGGDRVTAWVYLIPTERVTGMPRVDASRQFLEWDKFKIGDQVVNAISPSAVGTVVNPRPKPGFVKVRFEGHGADGICLPLDQVEWYYGDDEDEDDEATL